MPASKLLCAHSHISDQSSSSSTVRIWCTQRSYVKGGVRCPAITPPLYRTYRRKHDDPNLHTACPGTPKQLYLLRQGGWNEVIHSRNELREMLAGTIAEWEIVRFQRSESALNGSVLHGNHLMRLAFSALQAIMRILVVASLAFLKAP